MDGVPMITQCAIPSFTTFQYKFRASSPGTHFYHAFSDRDRSRGLFGALVVREADKAEPHRKLYDKDLKEHVLLLSIDENNQNILINGRGSPNENNMNVYNVKEGERYRFRIAYVAGILTCPLIISIENHLLTIVSLDGNPIEPYETKSARISKGERLDFILSATQKPKTYTVQVESQCQFKTTTGTALIKYHLFKTVKTIPYGNGLHQKTPIEPKASLKEMGFENMKNINEISEPLQTETVDHTFYLGYDYKFYEDIDIAGE